MNARDRFVPVLGAGRGCGRPDDRLLVIVACPQLGRQPLQLRAYAPVSQAVVLAAAIEHFDYRGRPVSLRRVGSAVGPLPALSGVVFRDPGPGRVELELLPGVGAQGRDWWHGDGCRAHPAIVAFLERAETDPGVTSVHLLDGPNGAALRAEGPGEPETLALGDYGRVWLERSWPLWMRAQGILSPPPDPGPAPVVRP